MSGTLAFAQAGGASGAGAEVPEKSGAAANGQGGVVGATTAGMKKSGMKKDSMSKGGMKKDGMSK